MIESKALPKREELPAEHTWNLVPLFPDEKAWEREFKRVRAQVPKMARFRGKLTKSTKTLAEAIRADDELDRSIERLYTYAHLRHDENTQDPKYQAMHDRATNLAAEAGTVTSYMVPEILTLPKSKLKGLLKNKELAFARVPLREIIRSKDHVLTEPEERLLAAGAEALSASEKAYSMYLNADIRFPKIRDEKGEEVELTQGRYISYMMNQDRNVRKQAFETLYGTFDAWKNTLTAMLDGQQKTLTYISRVRKYRSAIEASLDDDEITTKVYDGLIRAVHEAFPSMYRYTRLRRRMLGVDELHMYDVYVPLLKSFDRKVPYDEAVELTRRAVEPLGAEYIEIVGEAFANRWIDRYENLGKRTGAYSSGCYDSPAYILLNYDGRVKDLFTLAHEMGHSCHSYLSKHTQPHIQAQYPIFLAEVASTVNEALLMDHLMKEWTSTEEQAFLVNHHLEEFRTTVFRQTMFAEFERGVSALVDRSEPLTPDRLKGMYRKLNADYFGPDVVLDPGIDMEWARIPHFYYDFYVYKYATGYSAATAIAKMILDGKKGARDAYLDMLRSGGSKPPLAALKDTGVDMATPKPVRTALKVFGELVGEMETLAGKLG